MSDKVAADKTQDAPEPGRTAATPMPRGQRTILGLYLGLSFLVQIALLIGFWPVADQNGKWGQTWKFFKREIDISDDARLIVIVLLSGGVGAMVHALRSFSAHVGAGRLTSGWGWWYILRPIEGATIGLAFYLVLRAGLINTDATGDSAAATVSVYGVAGVSVLVGMFSLEAVAKLKELAETLFSKASMAVGDGASKRFKPTIGKVDRTTAKQGADQTPLTVTGTGFQRDSIVRVDGTARITKYVSSTEVIGILTLDDTKDAGVKKKISVFTPPPGGGESAEDVTIEITQA